MGDTAPVPEGARNLTGVSDLAVVAHPDDVEFLLPGVVLACRADPARSLGVVVCATGAGSALPDGMDATELVARRADEQRRAADLGGVTALVLLGLDSAQVRSPQGHGELVARLAGMAATAGASRVHTHDPTDRHPTHTAVAAATIAALRRLPAGNRPRELFGWEGWGGLGWLGWRGDPHRVTQPTTGVDVDAVVLARCHASQLATKHFDAAVAGRRAANATFDNPTTPDTDTGLDLAMDLTPCLNDDNDPLATILAVVEHFRARVADTLGGYLGAPPPPIDTPGDQPTPRT